MKPVFLMLYVVPPRPRDSLSWRPGFAVVDRVEVSILGELSGRFGLWGPQQKNNEREKMYKLWSSWR